MLYTKFVVSTPSCGGLLLLPLLLWTLRSSGCTLVMESAPRVLHQGKSEFDGFFLLSALSACGNFHLFANTLLFLL